MKITINIDDELTTTLDYLASEQEITNEQVLENTVGYFLQSARKSSLIEKVSSFKSEDLVAVEDVVNEKFEEVKARAVEAEALIEQEAVVDTFKDSLAEEVVTEEVVAEPVVEEIPLNTEILVEEVK